MPRAKKSDPGTYTKPDLRDRIKEKITKGDKGGNPGQWSARKAQLVTQEYEKEGGDYKKPQNKTQKSLKSWGDEKWTTADGKKARRAGGTTRYLPEKAWNELTPAQKKATQKKKTDGSNQGKQFVGNTKAAASARKKAVKKSTSQQSTAKKASAKKTAKNTAAQKNTAPKKSAKKNAGKKG